MGVRASAEFTRPSDAAAYAAKDVVADLTDPLLANVLTFKSLGAASDQPDGLIQITAAKMMTSQTTNVARFRLHLFRTVPTALGDNTPCTAPLYADRVKYIGVVDFAAMQVEGTGATSAYTVNSDVGLAFLKDDVATHSIFGILETLDVFTPATGQTFYVELSCVGEVN